MWHHSVGALFAPFNILLEGSCIENTSKVLCRALLTRFKHRLGGNAHLTCSS